MPRSLAWMRPKLTNFHKTTFGYLKDSRLHGTFNVCVRMRVYDVCLCRVSGVGECQTVWTLCIHGSWPMQIRLRRSTKRIVACRADICMHTAYTWWFVPNHCGDAIAASIYAKVLVASFVCERECVTFRFMCVFFFASSSTSLSFCCFLCIRHCSTLIAFVHWWRIGFVCTIT